MARVLLNLLAGSPDKLSGISIYALRTFEALLRRNAHHYAIVSNWNRGQLEEHLPVDGIELIPGVTHRSEKLQYLLETLQIGRAAKRWKADVVFTPWPFATALGGKRRVMVVHDLYRETHPDLYPWHFRLAWSAYFPLSVARASDVVCVSDTTREEFIRFHPEATSKATTVLESSTIRAKPRPQRPREGRYGLTVSTTAPTKNLPRLIEAMEVLRQRGGPQAPIVWIGSDGDGVVREALRRHPGLATFIPIGRVDEESLATWYAHADFYIAASLTEGFCLPIVEAQKLGVPTLTSDVPIFREVAGNGGLFFDPLSPDSIADAITRISDARTRGALAEHALRNAERFSWDKSAGELEALFRG